MVKICLDAGHGGGKSHNRGALYGNEGDNNYRFACFLGDLLTKDGFSIVLTRKKATDNPSLKHRGSLSANCDLLLSCHSNAFKDSSVRGIEIFDDCNPVNSNKIFAEKIGRAVASEMQSPWRGVKYKRGEVSHNWYGILRYSRAKNAMLLESGFHTNEVDALYYYTSYDKIALAVANAISSYYFAREEYNNALKDNETSLYKVQIGAFSDYVNATECRELAIKRGFLGAFIDKS